MVKSGSAAKLKHILFNIEISCCFIFVETYIYYDMVYDTMLLFEIKLFCNIVRVSAVTIYQYNASFLDKNDYFLSEKK